MSKSHLLSPGPQLQHSVGAGGEVWEDAHHPGGGWGGARAVPAAEGRPHRTRTQVCRTGECC